MRGNDCAVIPEWWEPELPPLQAANLNHARDLVKRHTTLHPSVVCKRLAAASAYIAKAEQSAADDQPQGMLHRSDGSIAAVYPDGLVLDADDR
jgi:hypothetical protein